MVISCRIRLSTVAGRAYTPTSYDIRSVTMYIRFALYSIIVVYITWHVSLYNKLYDAQKYSNS